MEKIDFNTTETNFLPSPRSGKEVVLAQTQRLSQAPLLDEIFSKIPLMFQILNNDRQVVYMNTLLKNELEEKGIEYGYGYRPGEILQCQNAFTQSGGCGTSSNCQYCGIVNCVIEAKEKDGFVSKEASFISQKNDKTEMINYLVSSKPFIWQNEKYIILTFDNISDKKRKEQLERTFFHDLLNKVSSVAGLSELMGMDPSTESNEFVEMIKRGIYDLADEIKFQRNISMAERDELVLNIAELSTTELLKNQQENFKPYESTFNKQVLIDKNIKNTLFRSDKVLINRILTNLIKNALEAVNENESVTVGSKNENGNVIFWVKNNLVLSDEIKAKIFNRSFSTKGAGRGIGTYSVKLFTEKYLDGKAYFTSNEGEGTIFFVEFPLF
jgi:K+-sensing histidine kinase KdpD